MSEAKYIKGEWKARGGGGPYEVGAARYVIPPHIVDEYTDEQGRKVTAFIAPIVNELDYAKFIVLACNNFDALLAACKYAKQFIDEYDPDLQLHPSLRSKLSQAIDAAEGK